MLLPEPIIDPNKFSKWTSLLRSTAFVFRFIKNVRAASQEHKTSGALTQPELAEVENYLYRLSQCSAYADEIAALSNSKVSGSWKLTVLKTSPIYRLCPFLDEHKVLRVHGRTAACKYIDTNTANPVILPRHHQITKLIVAHYHRNYQHQNHTTIINESRQRYSISRLKATYNRVRKECQQC